MTSYRMLVAAPLAALVFTVSAFAADVTGSWKWTTTAPGGNTMESSAKLEAKDGKVTGTVVTPRGQNAISDGTVTADQIKFNVEREGRDGKKMVIKYEGKLDADTIKGTITMPSRDGGERKVDWNATRIK